MSPPPIHRAGAVALLLVGMAGAPAATPSFDCSQVRAGSIAALVCADDVLAALDRQLAGVYAQARPRAAGERPPSLQAEQRGWVKGRDDCWKAEDRRACVADAYTRRIATLQARYRLVPSTGPVFFTCDGQPANEVVATYFSTTPPTALVERGDSVSLMFLARSASGSRYVGPNESLWEHQGRARVVWGTGAPTLDCVRRP